MLRIRLLGHPSIETDLGPRRLEGMKPWALLAALALAERPLARRELAERIWPTTGDPLASVRWALLQVRRAVQPEATIVDRDGLLALEPADGIEVDVRRLIDGRLDPETVEDLVRGDLLDGVSFRDAPGLEEWLALERARVASASGAALRFAATLLSRREPTAALRLLGRATGLDPYDDVAHELTVDILVGQADRRAALAYVERLERRYRDELATEVPATVRRPLERPIPRPEGDESARVTRDVAVESLLEASAARQAAGDYPGAETLARRAAAEAATAADALLEARVLVGLAGTLIHTVRGRDHEASGILERGLVLAVEAGDVRLAAEAERELGWVAFLDGAYGAAESTLGRAIASSELAGDRSGAARARMVLGACRSDRAEFAAAEATLAEAIDELEAIGDRWVPFATAFLGRTRMRAGDPEAGRDLGERSTAQARSIGWLSLLPWTLAVAGEGRLLAGDGRAAGRAFEEGLAHALGIGDPCWEAFSLRGIGLVQADRGDRDDAIRSLRGAVTAARRLPDVYAWCEAVCLVDLIELDAGVEATLVEEALRLTGTAPMPDLHRRIASATATRPPRG